MASRFVAGDSEVYISVVMHGIYKLRAIVQLRCLGLKRRVICDMTTEAPNMDIHTYKCKAIMHHNYLPRLTAQQKEHTK